MQVTDLVATGGLVASDYQMCLSWKNPVGTFEKIRIIWKATGFPTSIDDGDYVEITDGSNGWLHTGLTVGNLIYYHVVIYDGSSWGTPAATNMTVENSFGIAGTTAAFFVKDEVGNPLPNHIITITRVRGSLVLASAVATVEHVDPQYNGVATATIPGAGDLVDTVVWVGDEIVVLVESAPGVTLYETTILIDPTMIVGYLHVIVQPAAVAPQYPATPTIPAGINLTSTSMTRPYFIWTHTPDPDNSPSDGKVHYAIEMDTNADFTEPHSANYRLYKSVTSADGFEYALESSSYETWLPFPAEGLVETGNARIRFTVPSAEPALAETTWRWRVYSTDLTPA